MQMVVMIMSDKKIYEDCQYQCHVVTMELLGEPIYTCTFCGEWKTVKDSGDLNEF